MSNRIRNLLVNLVPVGVYALLSWETYGSIGLLSLMAVFFWTALLFVLVSGAGIGFRSYQIVNIGAKTASGTIFLKRTVAASLLVVILIVISGLLDSNAFVAGFVAILAGLVHLLLSKRAVTAHALVLIRKTVY